MATLPRASVLAFACACLCHATTYYCDLIPGPAFTGINNSGATVGGRTTLPPGSGLGNAITSVPVNYPGAQRTTTLSINNTGVITGEYTLPDTVPPDVAGFFTFSTSNGEFSGVSLPAPYDALTPEAQCTTGNCFSIFGINDNGAISGVLNQYGTGSFFILNIDKTITLIAELPPAANGVPGNLNNALQVVETQDVNFGGAQLRNADNTVTPLRPAGISTTFASGINNAGITVGYGNTGDSDTEWLWGFTRDAAGNYGDLICANVPRVGLNQLKPLAINDNGVIVGGYLIATTTPYTEGAFIAMPVLGEPLFIASPVTITGIAGEPATGTITIANGGTAGLDIGGFTSNGFTVSGCVEVILPGSSCLVTATVTPAAGSNELLLVVYDSAAGSPHAIPITVIGETPVPIPPPAPTPVPVPTPVPTPAPIPPTSPAPQPPAGALHHKRLNNAITSCVNSRRSDQEGTCTHQK